MAGVESPVAVGGELLGGVEELVMECIMVTVRDEDGDDDGDGGAVVVAGVQAGYTAERVGYTVVWAEYTAGQVGYIAEPGLAPGSCSRC